MGVERPATRMGTFECGVCGVEKDTERKVRQHVTMKKDEQHGGQQGVTPPDVDELVVRAGDQEDDPDDDTPELEESGELDFEDEDAKEYQCGACGAEVEYLTNECPECGEQLMWGAV